MDLDLAFYTFQIIPITSLAIVGLSFILSQPSNVNARLAALICFSNISYLLIRLVFNPHPVFHINPGVLLYPIFVVANTGPGLWMVLCFRLFQDERKIPLWLLGTFALQLLLSAVKPLYIPYLNADIDIPTIGEFNFFLFGTLPLLLQFLFTLAALFWAIRGWNNDLLESRRTLRAVIVAILGLVYVGGTGAEFLMTNFELANQQRINIVISLSSPVINLAFALAVLRIDSGSVEKFIRRIKFSEPEISADDFELEFSNFNKVFKQQKAYLEPGLSIADLAKKMHMPQYKLRLLINQKLGYRNFNALLNEYRIEEACQYFNDETKNKLPILSIALDVGFQSIAPFNSAFKQRKGVTPSEFRKQMGREQLIKAS